MAIQLPYTLQTWVGMVRNHGAPEQRRLPAQVAKIARLDRMKFPIPLPRIQSFVELDSYTPDEGIVKEAVEYLEELGSSHDKLLGTYTDERVKKYAANLSACTSDISNEDLKRHIRARTRFDLEQAAAVVVSAFMKSGRVNDAVRLVKELDVVLGTSCMWVEEEKALPTQQSIYASPAKLAERLQTSAAKKGMSIPLATSYQELVPLLLRVRRCKPDNRCLHIPEWMFEEAGIEPLAHFKAFFEQGDGAQNPVAPREADSIILSRRHFRADQRFVYHLFQFWKPEKKLRKSIKKLEEKVLYASSWIQKRVFDVDDVALLCRYFFHFQRRLQRKVVSNSSGYVFLGKGEGRRLYQNNPAIKSTFENVLLEIVESNEEGVVVAMGDDDTLALIDETCLLMKEFVDVHGGGNTQNLTFKKGQIGGARGPVDEYNLLCDILAQLRQQAKDEGIEDVPGPTWKFLAKDIMHSNNSWEDDAFANGRKAGWEDWLQKRELMQNEGWDLVMR